ncbi:transmembrane protein, putative (macronuclear) [Tetrahymena thermophila SB210]|uniref:Transmembrane protein, putative n=1 Tax=Tetrahymena thermophila (strain SB210) TaxID=312017 RepID=Q22UE5_TETTS|nr:transmembrane protein, putative [Tetrahymena thermophila SB210]EAR88742.2 transmembrane protein, putative [Tetrahymena thermophila SB210]|eukprot:XP_001008987.2 transmembrane protein, putative [Tetrahymena thermophila SB210]
MLIQELPLYHNQYKRGKGVIYETIYSNHQMQCQLTEKECFCQRFNQGTYIKQQNEQDEEDRHNFLIGYMHDIIQDYYQKNNTKSIRVGFQYIYFTLFILKDPLECLKAYFSIKNSAFQLKQQSIKYQSIIYEIELSISQIFNEQFMRQYSSNHHLEMIEVIQFEQKKNQFEDDIIRCIKSMVNFYDYLQNHQLSFKELEQISQNLLQQKNNIKDNFKFLSKFAEYNEGINILGQIYLEAFDQNCQNITQFFQEQQRQTRKYALIQNKNTEQINPKDGVIYCQFTGNSYKIKSCSEQIINIIQHSRTSLNDYNLEVVFPTEKYLLKSFQLDPQNRHYLLNQRDRFGFGMNEQNFIVPVKLTTKIQQMSDEIGICVLVKQLYLPFGLILLQNDGRILGLNRSLYYHLNFVETSDLIGKNIEEFIPILKYTRIQTDLNNCTQQSIFYIIGKKDQTQLLSNTSINQFNINSHVFFDITFRVITIQLDNKPLYQYIEISDFRELDSHQEIQHRLQIYDNQINIIKNSQQNIQTAINSFVFEQEESLSSDNKEDKIQKQSQLIDSKRVVSKINANMKTSIFENASSKIQSQQTIKINERRQTVGFQQKFNTNLNSIQLMSSRREINIPTQIGRQDILSGEDLCNVMSTRDFKSARVDTQQEIALYLTPSSQVGKKKVEFAEDQNMNSPIKAVEEIALVSNIGSSLFSRTSTYKIILSRKIKSKSMACNLSYFFMIGFISLTLLLLVNYIVYHINMNGIDDFSSSYEKVSNPVIMYMKTLDTMRSISYYYLMKENAPSINRQNELKEMNVTRIDQQNIFIDYKQAYVDLLINNPNINLITMLQSLTVNITDIQNTPDDNGNSYNIIIDLFQALTQYYMSSLFIIMKVDPFRENFLWYSILNFKQSIITFQNEVQDNMNSVLSQSQSDNNVSFIIILSSSISLIFILASVVLVQQIQKKRLLSLLGCFQPSELQQKVGKLQNLIQEYKEQNCQTCIFNSTNNKANKNQINQSQALSKSFASPRSDQQTSNKLFESSNLQKRKRLQASFDDFKFFTLKDLFLGILILVFLNIQPLLSIILFGPYIKDQQWLISQQIDIYAIARTIIQEAAPQVLNLEWFWRKQDPTQGVFLDLINSQATENLQNLQIVEQLAQQDFVPNYNEIEYENFYKQMLTGNMCQTSSEYPQYFKTNFTLNDCNNLYQGILQKGFLITVKKAFQELESLMDFYNHYPITPDGLKQSQDYYKKNLINGNSLTDLNNLLKFINQSVDSFRRYFIHTSSSYCQKIQSIFFFLFILQIVLVTSLIMGVWILVQKKLISDIEQIKSYFSLFNISLLSTNSTLNKYFTNDVN